MSYLISAAARKFSTSEANHDLPDSLTYLPTQSPMLDLIYLLATLGFFFGSIAYAWWCGKI